MRVSVVAPTELGTAELAAWRRLQAASGLASPFLSAEFACAVAQVRDDAYVSVVEDGGDLAGFFAFQRDADGQGAAIGAGLCDAQAFVCHPDLAWDAQWLLRASGLTCWRFDHLSVEQTEFAPYHQMVHRSPVIDLRAGHDAFRATVKERSKDILAQVGRRRRKLEREVGPVITEWDEGSSDAFETLKTWKSAQYAATGVWDRFDHPWICELLEGLRQSSESACRALVTTTRAGERLVAVHLGLAGPDRLSWWFPAYDTAFAAYSPGLIQLLDLAEQAAGRSMTTIDLGRGEHDYKLRVATGSYDVAEGLVPTR